MENKNLTRNLKGLLFVASMTLATVGCKSNVFGEFVQSGQSSLRMFEESTGALIDLRNGKMEVDVDATSLLPTSDTLILKIMSEGKTYPLRIHRDKIQANGTFKLDESELEQPIQVEGKISKTVGGKALVEAKILNGFSVLANEVGTFKVEIDTQILKSSEFLSKHAGL